MSRSLTQNDGMDFIIRNAAATERDLLASTREPTRHRRAFSAFRPNLSRSTYSNLLSDCTKSLDKKNIVLQSSFSKISTYSLFLLGTYFFFPYRLYVTMQQGKKPLVQKRSNMSSSPSYAIQQKIIFGKKYIVVIHVMFQSLVSWQLQTTKNVIGSPIIRYNTIFIQYSKFVLSISQLPKNRYTYLIIYFGQGNFKQEGIKVILVFYFHNFSLVPLYFSVMKSIY